MAAVGTRPWAELWAHEDATSLSPSCFFGRSASVGGGGEARTPDGRGHRARPTRIPPVVDLRKNLLEPTECRGLGKSGKPDYTRHVQALPHDGWGSSKPSQAELFRQEGHHDYAPNQSLSVCWSAHRGHIAVRRKLCHRDRRQWRQRRRGRYH